MTSTHMPQTRQAEPSADHTPEGYFAVDVTRPGMKRLLDFMAKTQRLIDEGVLFPEHDSKTAEPPK
jgi:hypothetical protein